MIIFYFAIICLIYFSYCDLKTKQLDNWKILTFFLIGLIWATYRHQLIVTIIGCFTIGIIVILMWMFKLFGGADAKLIIALVPFLSFHGGPNMLVTLLLFKMTLGIIGVLYGTTYKLMYKKEKTIPFIPAIAVAYLLSILLSFN